MSRAGLAKSTHAACQWLAHTGGAGGPSPCGTPTAAAFSLSSCVVCCAQSDGRGACSGTKQRNATQRSTAWPGLAGAGLRRPHAATCALRTRADGFTPANNSYLGFKPSTYQPHVLTPAAPRVTEHSSHPSSQRRTASMPPSQPPHTAAVRPPLTAGLLHTAIWRCRQGMWPSRKGTTKRCFVLPPYTKACTRVRSTLDSMYQMDATHGQDGHTHQTTHGNTRCRRKCHTPTCARSHRY